MSLLYHRVPKNPGLNLAYRRKVIEDADGSPSVQAALRNACKADLLFWVNTFLWTYDPRKSASPHLPFVTWPFQDRTLLTLQECRGNEDVLIEKSRDMGASWMCLVAFLHAWQFMEGQAFAIISRNQDLVDKPGDADCLYWKLDYLLKHQPRWLLPNFERLRLHLENVENGSTIDGFSTTGNVLRGGRRTAALVDEFAAFEPADGYAALAATQHATRSRIFNSTPQGAAGAFYEMAQSGIRKERLHWTLHPEKIAGLYYDDRGKARSTWYDNECQRTPIPALIAQELDIDYAGSASMFFDALLIEKLIALDSRPPYHEGRLEGGLFVPEQRAA